MNDEEKKVKQGEYVNVLARLGETIVASEIAADNIAQLKAKAKELLNLLKEEKPK